MDPCVESDEILRVPHVCVGAMLGASVGSLVGKAVGLTVGL